MTGAGSGRRRADMEQGDKPDTTIVQLVYASRSAEHLGEAEIEKLLRQCVHDNQAAGITGFLLFDGACFLQLLEGSPRCVDDLYRRIEHDPRHRDSQALIRQEVRSREFSCWSMAYLFVQDDGIARFIGTMSADAARRLAGDVRYGDSVLRTTIADYLCEIARQAPGLIR